MARHKRPWCRYCNKRKARGLYEDDGFCSTRCAANGMWAAWHGEQEEAGPDDWCLFCGLWSTFNPQEWAGTMSPIPDHLASDPDLCKCPVPIPSWTGEPYIKEEYDDD